MPVFHNTDIDVKPEGARDREQSNDDDNEV